MSTEQGSEGMDALQQWCTDNGYDNDFYKKLKEFDFEEPYDLKLLNDNDFDELCNELKFRFGKKTKLKKHIMDIKKPQKNNDDNKNDDNKEQKNDDNHMDLLGLDNDDAKQGKTKNTSDVISLTATPEYKQYPMGQRTDKFYVMVSLKAPYFQPKKRAPIDLVCVVDTSGSMSGARINLVKETLKFIVMNLTGIDRFGCIGFSSNAYKIVDLENMNDLGRNKAIKLIDKMTATGSTALCAGLVDGVKMLRQRDAKSKVSSVLLFTDGQTNVGPKTAKVIINSAKAGKILNDNQTNPNDLQDNSNSAFSWLWGSNDNGNEGESDLPVINSFGFGTNHNATLLQDISEHGNGLYGYIENTKLIGETFAQCIGGLISMAAKDLKVTIEVTNENVMLHKNLNDYKVNTIKKGKIIELMIPDMQSEEERDLLFTLALNKTNEVIDSDALCKFSLEYFSVVSKKKLSNVTLCSINRTDNTVDIGLRDFKIDKQKNRIDAADAMDSADKLGNSNNLKEARLILTNAIKSIQKSVSKDDVFCKSLVEDLQQCYDKLKSRNDYISYGSKKLKMKKKAHKKQRAIESNNNAQMCYKNSYQQSMMDNWNNNYNNNF